MIDEVVGDYKKSKLSDLLDLLSAATGKPAPRFKTPYVEAEKELGDIHRPAADAFKDAADWFAANGYVASPT